jgi:hypothetical protein
VGERRVPGGAARAGVSFQHPYGHHRVFWMGLDGHGGEECRFVVERSFVGQRVFANVFFD